MQIQTRINLHHAICLISATKHFWKNFPENVSLFFFFGFFAVLSRITIQFCLYFEGDCVFCFVFFLFFFKHLCVHKRIQPLFRCVGIGVYKRCECANLERCQLTLRKKDKLMANVSFDQDMEFYISVYLLKSQLKLHLFVESRFLCSI